MWKHNAYTYFTYRVVYHTLPLFFLVEQRCSRFRDSLSLCSLQRRTRLGLFADWNVLHQYLQLCTNFKNEARNVKWSSSLRVLNRVSSSAASASSSLSLSLSLSLSVNNTSVSVRLCLLFLSVALSSSFHHCLVIPLHSRSLYAQD